jgi:branched-chain amino acid transport system permease protein
VAGTFLLWTYVVFSGPFAENKFSVHSYLHQLTLTRTYAYVVFGVALWLLVSARLDGRVDLVRGKLLASRPWRAATLTVFALVFAAGADPWLAPTVNWHHLLPGGGDDLWQHWPTYLWLALGLLLGLVGGRVATASRVMFSRSQALMTRESSMVIYAVALFAAIEVPKFLGAYWQVVMYQQIGVMALLAVGLNVVVGFAGLLDLGYVAFFAFGCYVTAYFTGALPLQPFVHLSPFEIIPFAILAAMGAGVLLGLPTLRLRGDYLAIVTLGFGEIIVLLATNLTRITGGSQGSQTISTFRINFLGVHYQWMVANALSFYYLMIATLVIVIILFTYLNNSRVGRTWAAIREDEVAAESLGISGLRYKVMAFAIGASTAGVAGVFSAAKVGILFPQSFVLQFSITVLVLVIFGGMGSILGVLVGAAVLQWLPMYLTFHSYFGYEQQDLYLYIGALLVIMMIFRPQGLVPSRRRMREIHDAAEGQGTSDAMGVNPEGPLA